MTSSNRPNNLRRIVDSAEEILGLPPDAVGRLFGYMRNLGADSRPGMNTGPQSGPGRMPAPPPAARPAPATQRPADNDVQGELSRAIKAFQAKGYPPEFIHRVVVEQRMRPDRLVAMANSAPQFTSHSMPSSQQAGKPIAITQKTQGKNSRTRQNTAPTRRPEPPQNVPYESRNPDDLLPETRRAYDPAMEKINDYLRPLGMEAFPTCTYRNQARQNELYKIGRTPGDRRRRVTGTLHSPHTPRKAWDIAVRDKKTEKVLDKGVPWQEIGKLGKDAGNLEWGGDWPKLRDYGHFQLPD
jgi:hypothetical protein